MKKESTTFDFGSLKAKDTVTMHLKDPNTGKDIPGVSFELYSKDSEVFKAAELKIDRRRMKRMQGFRSPVIDPAESRQESLELLVACIASWQGVVFHGQQFEYSQENALKLLEEVPEVAEQIDRFVGDRRNFLN